MGVVELLVLHTSIKMPSLLFDIFYYTGKSKVVGAHTVSSVQLPLVWKF